MADSGYVLAIIMDRSCGHCRNFHPDAERLKNDPELNSIMRVDIQMFDQQNGRTITPDFGFITAFPTIAIFPANVYRTRQANTQNVIYPPNSPRSYQTVKDWALNYAGRNRTKSLSGYGGASYGTISRQPPSTPQATGGIVYGRKTYKTAPSSSQYLPF